MGNLFIMEEYTDINLMLLVIPARKGSKGIKDKNLIKFNGLHLVEHTMLAAQETIKLMPEYSLMVTTDCPYVTDLAHKHKIHIAKRPHSLSNDNSTLDQVICHIAKNYKEFDSFMCLPPTSPLRSSDHIIKAINIYNQNNAQSLLSVTEEHKTIWTVNYVIYGTRIYPKPGNPLVNRQLSKHCYISNGAITITSRIILEKLKCRYGGKTIPYQMPKINSIDIDTYEDLEIAEAFVSRFKKS